MGYSCGGNLTRRKGGGMKPLVLQAQSKELWSYIKGIGQIDQASLLEVHKKLLKMQVEVSEILEKM